MKEKPQGPVKDAPVSAFRRWFFLILVLWAIPAATFWGAIGIYDRLSLLQKTQASFERLEASLEEVSENSDETVFLQNGLKEVFHQSLKGLFARKNLIESVIHKFQKEFPPNLLSLFVFNSDGLALFASESPEEGEILYRYIREAWDKPIVFEEAIFKKLSNLSPLPEILAKTLKGRPGKVFQISRNARATWGFYDLAPQPSNRVAGFMALIHQDALPRSYILDQMIGKGNSDDFSFGYWMDGESPRYPGLIASEVADDLQKRFWIRPESRFELDRFLVVMTRTNETTLLIGVAPRPSRAALPWIIPGALYVLISLMFLISTYRRMALDRLATDGANTPKIPRSGGLEGYIPVKGKIFGFYTLGFGLPFFVAGILATLYLAESKIGMKDEYHRLLQQRLSQIDAGFEQSLNRRLWLYRRQAIQWKKQTADPDSLIKSLNALQEKGLFDNYYLVSSQSLMVGQYRYFAHEVKRHLHKRPEERRAIFDSWIDRGFSPTPFLIEKMLQVNNQPDVLFPKNMEYDDKLLNFIEAVSDIALQEFNSSRNVQTEVRVPKGSQLVIGSLLETEMKGLFQGVRTNVGSFFPMEGTGEYSTSFLEILPGPGGEAWYSVFLFHDLLTLEKAYLAKVFSLASWDTPSVTAPSMAHFGYWPSVAGTSRLGQPFADNPEIKLHAVSLHSISPGFPKFDDYKQFRPMLEKLETTNRQTGKTQMMIAGQEIDVFVLKCSFLKRYYLAVKTPANIFEKMYLEKRNQVFRILVGIFLFGLLVAVFLAQKLMIPLSWLFESLQAMEAKRFDFRVPVSSRDELGTLCEAFNKTMDRLKDLELARAVQTELLPAGILRSGEFEIAGRNIMTQSVGGDYYDFIVLNNGLVAIILGDVSGHGISAALVTAMAKAAFTILCPRYFETPQDILARVNQEFLSQLKRAKMMTCFLGILDTANQRLICANAGQTYPFLLAQGGTVSQLACPSIPLGIRGKSQYVRNDLDLRNTTVILYSDGLVEALNASGDMFSYERLGKAIEKQSREKGLEFIEKVFEETRNFSGEIPWADDATMVVLRKL